MRAIVFASSSRYKIEIFERFGLPFTPVAPPYTEVIEGGADPKALATELALGKARSLSRQYPEHLIIGSDQVLSLEGRIFTKPGTTDAAVAQLEELRGKTHALHSAYALWVPAEERHISRVITSLITFYSDLSTRYLRRMVEQDRTWDCVGGYKYESMGIFLMERIETSDTNAIVGLPMIALIRDLQAFGYFPERLT